MRNLIAAFLGLTLFACAKNPDCSASRPENFAVFFKRFSQDAVFAIERTILPLETMRWEFGVDSNGKDESAPVKSYTSKDQYSTWKLIAAAQKEYALRSEVKSLGANSTIVDVFKPNTDLTSLYHFRTQDGCWFLWQHEDRSL